MFFSRLFGHSNPPSPTEYTGNITDDTHSHSGTNLEDKSSPTLEPQNLVNKPATPSAILSDGKQASTIIRISSKMRNKIQNINRNQNPIVVVPAPVAPSTQNITACLSNIHTQSPQVPVLVSVPVPHENVLIVFI